MDIKFRLVFGLICGVAPWHFLCHNCTNIVPTPTTSSISSSSVCWSVKCVKRKRNICLMKSFIDRMLFCYRKYSVSADQIELSEPQVKLIEIKFSWKTLLYLWVVVEKLRSVYCSIRMILEAEYFWANR